MDEKISSRYRWDLLQVCDEIVGGIVGSCDIPNDLDEKIEWLKYRANNWEPSLINLTKNYNQAVRNLIREALIVFEGYKYGNVQNDLVKTNEF